MRGIPPSPFAFDCVVSPAVMGFEGRFASLWPFWEEEASPPCGVVSPSASVWLAVQEQRVVREAHPQLVAQVGAFWVYFWRQVDAVAVVWVGGLRWEVRNPAPGAVR